VIEAENLSAMSAIADSLRATESDRTAIVVGPTRSRRFGRATSLIA
jgi:hypothetical protein